MDTLIQGDAGPDANKDSDTKIDDLTSVSKASVTDTSEENKVQSAISAWRSKSKNECHCQFTV